MLKDVDQIEKDLKNLSQMVFEDLPSEDDWIIIQKDSLNLDLTSPLA